MRNPIFLTLVALSLVPACNQQNDEPVDLEWNVGQTWHLGTTYRLADVHGETGAVDLDGSIAAVGELWSDEVVWTYQVVEHDFEPKKSDPLYDFAVTPWGKVRSLTVIKASVDASLNDIDAEMLDTDPVVYLVFTSKRNRMAGLVSFTNVDGERKQQAFHSTQLGRSWSTLSQSMLTAAPTYLAPFGVRVSSDERKLENGHYLSTDKVDDVTVDAIYDDEMGGGVVASRYEVGQPWPTWTVAENSESRLLKKSEVNGLRRRAATAPPADYDFRAALNSSVDIDSAVSLSQKAMDGETEAYGAPLGFQPWNGSWWPQSKSALVFGYEGRTTLSNRLEPDVKPMKSELDLLSKALGDLDKDSPEYATQLAEYQTKQGEFVDALVAFYDQVLADLDGGQLTIEGGQLTHADGWSYPIDELSPMDKVALVLYTQGETYPNPFFIPAWELLNHYSPEGGTWWGHCNGWSAAAILNEEPVEDVIAPLLDGDVRFTTADVKGLLSETHYSTYSHFFGARYYGEDDDISDLTPAAFHRIITFYLQDQQVPLVFDTDAGEQVWNFPAYAATVDVVEIDPSKSTLVNVNTATVEALDTLPRIGETLANRIVDYREENGPFQTLDDLDDVSGIGSGTLSAIEGLATVDAIRRTFMVEASVDFATDAVDESHVDDGTPDAKGFTEVYGYTLITDENGVVLEGTWDNDEEHPDFAWVPYSNPMTASGSENAYLSQTHLLNALGADLSRK